MSRRVVEGIEHVAIAVADVDAALTRFRALGFGVVHTEEVDGRIRSHILRAGEAYIELLEPLSADSALHRFLDRRGEGLHHLCLRVGSLQEAVSTAEAAGCGMVSAEPSADERGQRVFVHPATNSGVLMGMVEPYGAEGRRIVDPG